MHEGTHAQRLYVTCNHNGIEHVSFFAFKLCWAGFSAVGPKHAVEARLATPFDTRNVHVQFSLSKMQSLILFFLSVSSSNNSIYMNKHLRLPKMQFVFVSLSLHA